MPPTTPPAIAPVGVWEGEGEGEGVGMGEEELVEPRAYVRCAEIE